MWRHLIVNRASHKRRVHAGLMGLLSVPSIQGLFALVAAGFASSYASDGHGCFIARVLLTGWFFKQLTLDPAPFILRFSCTPSLSSTLE